MKKNIFAIMILAGALLFLTKDSLPLQEDAGNITMRVMIIDDKDSINLSLGGRYKITTLNSENIVMQGAFLSAEVKGTKSGLVIGKKETGLSAVRVSVKKDANISVNGRRFRGDIGIVRKDNGKLMVINYINLDDYLYGVLYHEVSHRWPIEALKAQAIAARTFALYQARQNKAQPYDLRNDIYSQVYGGRTSEKWSTTRAVDATRGKVLTYNGDIFPSYYHATCAGYTEDASNLWNVDMPVLKAVPCNFCANSPHYKWHKDIPLGNIEKKLQEKGYKIGSISSVNILSKNRSGRVDKLEIRDSGGMVVVLTGKDFRQMIGPNELRSAKFDAVVRSGSLAVDGLGWGHGVGMCQWGAFGMSRIGKKADEILKYYYPGAEITTIDKIANKL